MAPIFCKASLKPSYHFICLIRFRRVKISEGFVSLKRSLEYSLVSCLPPIAKKRIVGVIAEGVIVFVHVDSSL